MFLIKIYTLPNSVKILKWNQGIWFMNNLHTTRNVRLADDLDQPLFCMVLTEEN